MPRTAPALVRTTRSVLARAAGAPISIASAMAIRVLLFMVPPFRPRLPWEGAAVLINSRSRRRQREGQRPAVTARPERLSGADVLAEGDRHRVVGHRRRPRCLRELHPQRLGERERPV